MDDEGLTPIPASRGTDPGQVSADGVVAATGRLVLRRFDEADAAFIVALLNDPAFLRFIGDRKVRTLDDARGYISNGPQAMYASHGFGLYQVTLRETGERVGMCGLLKRDALDDPDVGFAFLPAYRAQGFGREALAAVMSLALEVHGLTRVAAIVQPDNAPSIRLLERAGFRTERRITMPGDTVELLLMGVEL